MLEISNHYYQNLLNYKKIAIIFGKILFYKFLFSYYYLTSSKYDFKRLIKKKFNIKLNFFFNLINTIHWETGNTSTSFYNKKMYNIELY